MPVVSIIQSRDSVEYVCAVDKCCRHGVDVYAVNCATCNAYKAHNIIFCHSQIDNHLFKFNTHTGHSSSSNYLPVWHPG